ncbi:hypothetical protein [Sulfobacillus thermosulfidooxidans]|uniref:hypothetical protein n=1 Tax=Sulfobacillus thermosulfidooxidans TaxID=28034 RepID=UPI0006B5AE5B|nr:hypothetical protein [Sulfobacillus thermosulfidooxidans]
MPTLDELWFHATEEEWKQGLEQYWHHVKPKNLAVERRLNNLPEGFLHNMSPEQFYQFLYEEYFPWKYTDGRILALQRKRLAHYMINDQTVKTLENIHAQMLQVDVHDTKHALSIVTQIHGIGPSAGSGLLSLLYPAHFGTVDRFVVENLQSVPNAPWERKVGSILPRNISILDAASVIEALRNMAAALNDRFSTTFWTPRKVDMVLWGVRAQG